MILKKLAVAMALAGVAAAATAAVAPANSGDGELFLVIQDSVAQISYLKDLGITQSKARVATKAEEKALRDRLYWLMEPRDRLVFDDLQIRPDIRRVFGTNVVITVASNSPTEVYTEINGDSVALFIGETGNLMARDPLRMSQLAPGMYLCRYVRP